MDGQIISVDNDEGILLEWMRAGRTLGISISDDGIRILKVWSNGDKVSTSLQESAKISDVVDAIDWYDE